MLFLGLMVIGVVALMLIKVPIGFAFGAGALVLILLYQMPFGWVMPSTFGLLLSFPLLAIPLFVFLGLIMQYSGLATRLIDFVNAVVGRMKGGLGLVVVWGCGAFGAISGSAASALATFGVIMFPRMIKEGYHRGYSVAVIVSSAMLALFIPPSMDMILFGFAGQLNISAAFLATVGPGLLIMIFSSIINTIMTRKFPIKTLPKVGFVGAAKEVGHYAKQSSFVFLLPVIVLGGIYGGIFTPTEAAAAGSVAALIVSFAIYKSMTFTQLSSSMLHSMRIVGMIVGLLFFLFVISRIVIWQNIVQELLAFLLVVSDNLMIQLLMLVILLILMGMIIDDNSGSILSGVLFLPVATQIGINPYHFAGMVMSGLGLGLLTPPVASPLYQAGAIMETPLNEYFKYVIPFMLFSLLPVLLLTTYIPEIATFLPNLVFGTGLGRW